LNLGAAGIQVGTAFAFCEESGIRTDLKQQAMQLSREGKARVFTDPLASPTGFPFKIAQLSGTMSDAGANEKRVRLCDLGFLRHAYLKPDGAVGYRCPAEPIADYVSKGGTLAETGGRQCVCNGLVATIGMPQVRRGVAGDLPLVTAGNDVMNIVNFLRPGQDTYSAAEVVDKLLIGIAEPVAS